MAGGGMTISAGDLWNSLPVPALLLDGRDLITDINSAAETFLNISARKLQGTPVFDRLAVDAPLDAALTRVRAGQSVVFVRNVDVTGGNTAPVPCNIQIAPMPEQAGDVLMLIEPQQMAVSLAAAHPVKSTARAAIGMAEMLSHEIKNPLAGITGAAQLLAMNLSAGHREMTDLIVAESRRIVALLDQVEQFGNLRPPVRRVVNIHDILNRALKSAAVGFAADMIIQEDFDPSLPPTYVDADQMIQVFLNLFKNAAQAAASDAGTLTIRSYYDPGLRLRRRDGTGNALPLQVEIIDDGPGLPQDIVGDIFEPFVSGRDNGTGLGLALVSKILADHDARIAVQSVPGRTMFRVSLPVAADDIGKGDT